MEDTLVNQGFLILHDLFSPLSPPFPPQKINLTFIYLGVLSTNYNVQRTDGYLFTGKG